MTKLVKIFLPIFILIILAVAKVTISPKEKWKTYEFIPGEEMAGDEELKPVGFSFIYPSSWNYKIFKREEGAVGGENILHQVSFLDKRIVVWADNHQFLDFIAIPAFAKGVKKIELAVGGQKAIKWVGKEVSPMGEAEKETVKVAIDALGDYTLIFEGEKEDEKIIGKMLLGLEFFRK